MYNNIFEYSEFFKYIDETIAFGIPINRYSISNFGRVYDNTMQKFLTIECNSNGYLFVSLHIIGQLIQFPIHELVGHYFVPKYKSANILRHIDGNIKNNFFMNLEWVYNINELSILEIGSCDPNKVNRKDIELICRLLEERNLTQRDIATASGIAGKMTMQSTANYVSRIYNGKIWRDISEDYNLKKERYRKRNKK